MVGIVSYGFYVPKYRIRTEEIANVWGKNPEDVKKSLLITEKAIAGVDEDSLTMAFESASSALSDVKVDRNKIKVVLFGSETHPYAVNPASTILAEFLGIEKNYLAYDTEFACKAATGAIISAQALIKSGYSDYALISGSDKGMGKTHDTLEYTASSGSVSLLLGKDDLILELLDFESFSSDTPDFWRREGIRYPSHGGRFSGKPSYFYHIEESSKSLLKKTGLKPEDFAYGVFHMPNGKFPVQVAKSLGFSFGQIKDSLTVNYLGNSYTASALMGLTAVLEKAKTGDLIFMCSYGSGAGSDSFVLKVTKNLDKRRKQFLQTVENKKYITYPTYLKFMEMI
ncbi:hydroxymethylglutaryl-CoA synthase [Candidatus Roizmanbacteria bacterium CG_4_8_14_3_um_filter_34_9]|uniref:Hydroxymethylglutaryl-CoA synthase n=1 Tax=Candidatus Roizmanbacteria bacterium CG_4_8_14_3_um_filter_34_9 TaxID=1974832 RepID=A0A2M7ICT1_9BACT|nr:MAG: hydroxymethylglutaryl-CoA synthase [Candidatus Roizmanbacteria bacterium CG_4_8_14_3_um_filter_34_9]